MVKIYFSFVVIASVLMVLFQSCSPASYLNELPVKNEHSRETQH